MYFFIRKCQTHRELYMTQTINSKCLCQLVESFPKLLMSPEVFGKLLMSPFFPYTFPTSCKYKTDKAFSYSLYVSIYKRLSEFRSSSISDNR